MADGIIKIKTKIDNTDAEKDLNELEKMADRTAKNVEKTKAKVTVSTETDDGASAKTKSKWTNVTNDSSLKKAQSRLQAIREEIKNIEAETNKDLQFAVTDDQTVKLLELEAGLTKELNAEYDHLIQQVSKYQQAKQEAVNQKVGEQQAKDNFRNASAELSTEAGATAFLTKIQTQEQYNAALATTKARMQEIEASARRIATEKGVDVNALLQANKEYQKLDSKLKILTAHQGDFKNATTKSFDGAKKAASKFTSAIQTGIKKISKLALAVVGIRSAYNAVRQVVNSYIAENEELQNSINGIKGAFAEMFGPAIERIINLLKVAIGYILGFVKALTGVDYAARYNEKALKKQTAATKELQRQSAGFDEQTKLSDTSSSGGGDDSGVPTFDFTISDSALDFFEELKGKIESGDWYGAGKTLGKKLMDGIEAVDWENVGTKIGDAIGGFLEFTLGFVVEIDLSTVGDAIGEFATGLFNSLSESLQEIDWIEVGNKLCDLLLTALAMTNIAWAIVTLIFTIGDEDLAQSASSFLGSICGALVGALAGIGERLMEIGQGLWDSIKGYFDEYVDWEGTPDEIITGLFNGIVDAIKNIGTWVYDNMWVPFRDAFKETLGIASPSKRMMEFGGYMMDGLFNGITGAIDKIKKACTDIWNAIKEKFSNVGNWFKETFSKAWQKVKDVFSKGGKIFDGIKEGIANTFRNIVNSLIDGINKIIAKPFNAINGMLNKIRNISVAGAKPFQSLWSEDPLSVPQIPKLAKGGIVNNFGKGVPIIAGEAGREAILPLDGDNAAWMDVLVDKINSGNTTVPIYLDGKMIAKYIIDLQKRQAFATNGGF